MSSLFPCGNGESTKLETKYSTVYRVAKMCNKFGCVLEDNIYYKFIWYFYGISNNILNSSLYQILNIVKNKRYSFCCVLACKKYNFCLHPGYREKQEKMKKTCFFCCILASSKRLVAHIGRCFFKHIILTSIVP